MPATAFTVAVPASVPLPGLASIAIVTPPLNDVVVWPFASMARTDTDGEIGAPMATFVGGCTNASAVGGRAVASAVMTSGDPASPATVAVMDCVPTALPSVQVTLAKP